jgi:hypothetical protein
VLAQLIGSATTARDQAELAAQLQAALDSRVLIEQAKGVLMERHGLDDDAAFTRLRRQARASSRKVVDVAPRDHRRPEDPVAARQPPARPAGQGSGPRGRQLRRRPQGTGVLLLRGVAARSRRSSQVWRLFVIERGEVLLTAP